MNSASLVLHAHLPYIRHPEVKLDSREIWLYEAIRESYLPLIRVLRELDVPGRLTLSVSPPLLAMLRDELLGDRFDRYLDAHIELAEREADRQTGAPGKAAAAIVEDAHAARSTYVSIEKDLVAAWSELAEAGRVELGICAGTHAILPLLLTNDARRLHVNAGVAAFEDAFGDRPRFMWLPECGFAPGVARFLADAGIWSTVVEARALGEAIPTPVHGKYAPVIDEDVAFFGRDPDSGALVWSSETGYPGDGAYREFHRDAAWDYPPEEVGAFVADDGTRLSSGVKLHRVTGAEEKEPWDRDAAFRRAREHARHFVAHLSDDLEQASLKIESAAHLTCAYDAELFGHWWHEGPEFLRNVFEIAHAEGLRFVTPSDFLASGPVLQVAEPATSTWGAGGDFSWWVDEATTWMIPLLHTAEERWREALDRRGPDRALAAATEELMLAQASDWPFAIRGVRHAEYAKQRVKEHLIAFDALLTGRTTPTAPRFPWAIGAEVDR